MSGKTRSRIRRRSVYIATIVAMLAMVGGFVLAAAFGGISGQTNQNGYTSAIGSTKFAGTVTIAGVPNQPIPPTCTPSPSTVAVTLNAVNQIVNVYTYGSGAHACVAGDFYEEFTVTPTAAVVSTIGDTFTMYSDITGTQASITITAAAVGSDSIGTLNLYVDYSLTTGGQTLPGSVNLYASGA